MPQSSSEKPPRASTAAARSSFMKWVRQKGILLWFGWVLAWIPVSFLFQANPHFPVFALLAPALGFLSIADPGGWSGNHFLEITLPWLVFWGVTLLIAILIRTANLTGTP